jgi:NAD-dependent deacetylase
VVWFGEALPAAVLAQATRATEACDLFLSIGTSSVVFPAAGLLDTAIARKIKTVEINLEETAAAGYVHWALPGKAGEILPHLVELAFGE